MMFHNYSLPSPIKHSWCYSHSPPKSSLQPLAYPPVPPTPPPRNSSSQTNHSHSHTQPPCSNQASSPQAAQTNTTHNYAARLPTAAWDPDTLQSAPKSFGASVGEVWREHCIRTSASVSCDLDRCRAPKKQSLWCWGGRRKGDSNRPG